MPKKAGKGVKSEVRSAVNDMKSGTCKPGAAAKRAMSTIESRKPKKK